MEMFNYRRFSRIPTKKRVTWKEHMRLKKVAIKSSTEVLLHYFFIPFKSDLVMAHK